MTFYDLSTAARVTEVCNCITFILKKRISQKLDYNHISFIYNKINEV